jgi:hypothetical protein
MFRFIKKRYYRKLFLRIYFSHLNHPNRMDFASVYCDAASDYLKIRKILFPKRKK